jgi:ABC-type Zn uptake system ZnuABC Zn-binding protein ZnuA
VPTIRSTIGGLALVPLAAILLASGCAFDGPSARADEEIVVVTTVAPLTSLVAAVVGDHAEVRGIVPEGVNSHTFEPSPSVAETLAGADLVFLNGLALEEPTLAMAEANVEDGTEIVSLGDLTLDEDDYLYDFSFPEEAGRPNPHLWVNPPMALVYADIVRQRMAELDPAHRDDYQANHDALAADIRALDEAMRTSLATVAPDDRKLLTYHDAYAYFARDYGWEVVGAIQMADFQEPSPGEVARLIDQVRTEGLPAIFGSEVFPSPVLEHIGREAGVRYIDVLRDDDLPGEPGDREHSLLELLRRNYVVITEASGGDASALESLDLQLDVADRATYPQ